MPVFSVFDRELPNRLKSMLAYQRQQPICIRLLSQHIYDFSLENESIFLVLRRLRTQKNADITLLLDKKMYNQAPQDVKDEIKKLEDVGIRFHTIKNLHAKIITVENNKEKCVLITSANLSNQGYYEAHEVGLYCQNHDNIYNEFKKYITNLIIMQNR